MTSATALSSPFLFDNQSGHSKEGADPDLHPGGRKSCQGGAVRPEESKPVRRGLWERVLQSGWIGICFLSFLQVFFLQISLFISDVGCEECNEVREAVAGPQRAVGLPQLAPHGKLARDRRTGQECHCRLSCFPRVLSAEVPLLCFCNDFPIILFRE